MARKTAEEAEKTRVAILAAARDEFTEHGYNDASTRAIVEQAGVTRGALYHYFRSKRDLFEAVFFQLTAEIDEAVRGGARTGTTPREAFLNGAAAGLEFARRPDYRQIAAIDGPAVLGAANWYATDGRMGIESALAGLRAMARAGELDVEPTGGLAAVLWGGLTAPMLLLAQGGEAPLTHDDIIEAVSFILSRLGRQPGDTQDRPAG